jgi:hypothetical protein
MKQKSLPALLSALLIISALHFVAYASARMQKNRHCDEAPLQKATEVAYALSKGADVQSLFPVQDPQLFGSELLSAFVLDSNGHVVAANTQVAHRSTPVPVGLLPHARSLGIKRVTWHPWPRLRKALVIRHVPQRNLYVAVAGPFDDAPDHNLVYLLAGSWIFCFAVLLLYGLLTRRGQADSGSSR